MHRRQLTPLIVFSLTVGMVMRAASPADAPVMMAAQDPPAIPRALLKRQSDRPQRFVRTELFFGTAAPGHVVTEEQFLEFLDGEVTRRFPDGLTLFRGHGRFTGKDGVLVKEDPFMVILLHPYDHFPGNNLKIEEIRRVYRTQFRQESVLRVDYQFSVRVTF